ncbi:Heat shock protein 90-5, chloroplastic [Trebouxia sp. C0009 RCD-2024]
MYFGYTPFWLYRTVATIIFTGFGAVIPAGPQDDGSLKEAMRNVTRDYEQLATIVQEFFATNSILDPQAEQRFQQFLTQKATRSYPRLEGLLDSLLLLYKIAWPFVVMTTAVKLMGRKEVKEESANLVDQVDKVQKKFDDGAVKGKSSHSSFKSAASSPRR